LGVSTFCHNDQNDIVILISGEKGLMKEKKNYVILLDAIFVILGLFAKIIRDYSINKSLKNT